MMREDPLVALLWSFAVLVAVVYLAAHGVPTPIVLALMTFLPRRRLDTTSTPKQ